MCHNLILLLDIFLLHFGSLGRRLHSFLHDTGFIRAVTTAFSAAVLKTSLVTIFALF